jgi:hypothetical protein
MKQPKPTKHSSVVFTQLCKLIPVGMVSHLAKEYGVDKQSRSFTPWSHVVSLLYAQLTHAIGLNDVCDGLRHHAARLSTLRGATPPSRNGLSNANKVRNADMMEALFWKEEGSHHDSSRMHALCAGLCAGEIAIFDKAYVHFANLFDLHRRGVFWVTRAKDNMNYHVCKKRKVSGNILRDDEITLRSKGPKRDYPKRMRRIIARVEVDGRLVEMAFLTNNLDWAASSTCDLYQSRWAIEVFFKQLKQTLQVCDFLGHSKQAIRWQIWSALLLYVLLRFQAWRSKWTHSFARLFTMIRSAIWDRFDLEGFLDFYGTAGGRWRMRSEPNTAYLPGLNWNSYGTA